MSERLVEHYGDGTHLVRLFEVTSSEGQSVMEAFTESVESSYQTRCDCGWADTAKYYQPARQKGLAHARTGS